MKSILTLFACFFMHQGVAAEFVAPHLTDSIVDDAGLMSTEEKAAAKGVITLLYERGLSQFTVLTVDSLQDLSIEQYGIKLADTWKLGSEKQDNGLILIVAPRERRMRFEVGRGLEGDIPDVVARRVLDDVIRPHFKNGQMGLGIVSGVFEIAQILGVTPDEIRSVAGQINTSARATHRKSSKRSSSLWELGFLILFVFIRIMGPLVLGLVFGFLGYTLFSVPGAIVGFIIGMIVGLILRTFFKSRGIRLGSGRGSSWYSGGGGFGSFGGGGGGWSGGGGSFGGGGSSSSW